MLAKLILAKGLIPCLLYAIGRIVLCTLGTMVFPALGLFPSLQSQGLAHPSEEMFTWGVAQVEVQQLTWKDTGFVNASATRYHYDEQGQLVWHQLVDARGRCVQQDSIAYNEMGHQVVHFQTWPSQAISQYNAWELTYQDGLLVSKLDRSSGLHHTYTYNVLGKLTSEVAILAIDSSFFYEEKNTYNDQNLLVKKVSRTSSLEQQWNHTYNETGQLTRKVFRQDVVGTTEGDKLRITTYSYDPEGRLSQQTLYAPDGKVLQEVAYLYDEDGRIKQKQVGPKQYHYHWNGEGRLVQINQLINGKLVAQKRYSYLPRPAAIMAIRD